MIPTQDLPTRQAEVKLFDDLDVTIRSNVRSTSKTGCRFCRMRLQRFTVDRTLRSAIRGIGERSVSLAPVLTAPDVSAKIQSQADMLLDCWAD